MLAPDYAYRARYPLHPLSFEVYVQLHKACQATGIVLQQENYEHEQKMSKMLKARVLDIPHLLDDKEI
jgi:hypothetical protein